MIRILSWNIRQGGGTRTRKIVDFLLKQNASIIVLSEFQNNANGAYIRQKLLTANFRFQFCADAVSNKNSVLVASKFPANSRIYFDSGYDFAEGVVRTEFDAFNLFGLYLPHKKKHKLFDLLLKEIDTHKPSILVGDFNTGKNFIDQKGDSFWYTDKLEKLEESGYSDAFRHINGEVESYSWYSHQGNGYRYDHSYVHNDLLAITKDCDYLHEARISGLSDHSPMLLILA